MEEILTAHFGHVRVSSMARPNKQFCRAMEKILMQQKQLHEDFLHGATDVG